MKPIAWMRRLGGRIIRLSPEPVWDTDEPLYTAPRELSDEEIHEVSKLNDVWIEQEDGSIKLSPYKFARAILKKASE